MNSALLNPRTFRPAFRSAQYLPLFSLARPCTSPKCSSKPLPRSTTQVRGAVGQVQTYRPTLRPQRAMTNELKELQKKVTAEQLPEDVGLLAGTFIRPLIRRMPSLLKEPKTWQLFLWTALKCWVKNAAMTFIYCRYHAKPKLPLLFLKRKGIARDLHRRMHTAFAEGDLETLKKICCPKLAEDFQRRIAQRGRNGPKVTWSLDKYERFPRSLTLTGTRVVSDRGGAAAKEELPGGIDFVGVRQIIVRIHSTQTVTSRGGRDASGAVLPEKKNTRDGIVEYVVIQQRVIDGKASDWKVWGMANETTREQIETDPAFMPGLSSAERLELMKHSVPQARPRKYRLKS